MTGTFATLAANPKLSRSEALQQSIHFPVRHDERTGTLIGEGARQT
jgi:hypothetical protein